ncbi:hypothetical protein GCM10009841_04090 [Microlunatus panaciterrae]|uniref:Uncharacterized protein n=1 Tax=Microlunatus panaciterrae TaxID=400768 RepID=A0ABS2RIY2_9ACTN|nr:hypothetical protein [Microlunatus panaciterrae]MBM7798932.1 hypothetical protein [Microlunatus panaciterrae]
MSMSQNGRAKIVSVLVAFACVVIAAIGLKVSEPAEDFDDINGTIGRPVRINGADLLVTRVQTGTRIAHRGEVAATTAGMFVVVRVVLRAPDQSAALSGAELASGKRVYASYTSLGSLRAEAGFEQQADLVFEVDPARIDDLTLRIWQREIVHGISQRALVTLGITRSNAEQWRTGAADRTLDTEEYGSSRAIP